MYVYLSEVFEQRVFRCNNLHFAVARRYAENIHCRLLISFSLYALVLKSASPRNPDLNRDLPKTNANNKKVCRWL
jgi:hypothetical protein